MPDVAIRKSDLRPHPDGGNKYLVATRLIGGPNLSVEPLTMFGEVKLTGSSDTGEYQTFYVEGLRVVVYCVSQYQTGAYAFPLVEG